MKRLLSFIWPQTTKVNSEYNGMLEVTFVNGKKLLDSKNANYSFGSLQKILETGISKVDLTAVNSILLLGLGGGSIITSLNKKFSYTKKIVAVELDPKIIEIAQQEFSISSSDNLKIVNQDAYHFVNVCADTFDLIIVDLFIDNRVPSQFYSVTFCSNLSRLLTKKSSLIFNLGMDEHDAKKKNNVLQYFKNTKSFTVSEYEKVTGTNSLLIAHKIQNFLI
ncbi:fused MFS/spermidine synthase [Wenyingzhuangia sp. 1_MG-2023]|nr:fused MFS/spermidine synthase [Wenyingzhuangia sp. 1_MG-2023]